MTVQQPVNLMAYAGGAYPRHEPGWCESTGLCHNCSCKKFWGYFFLFIFICAIGVLGAWASKKAQDST